MGILTIDDLTTGCRAVISTHHVAALIPDGEEQTVLVLSTGDRFTVSGGLDRVKTTLRNLGWGSGQAVIVTAEERG